jgi:hypothetical protein
MNLILFATALNQMLDLLLVTVPPPKKEQRANHIKMEVGISTTCIPVEYETIPT